MDPILVTVSSNEGLLEPITSKLAEQGVVCSQLGCVDKAMEVFGSTPPDLVIFDSGFDSKARVLAKLGRIQAHWPSTSVFLIAQKSTESLAIGALKAGVADYFRPPVCAEELARGIKRELTVFTEDAGGPTQIDTKIAARLVGTSKTMADLRTQLTRISRIDSTVLITGETGTGKELAARLIHENSDRACHPMVIVNCAALPDSLVESELFGYERGAFTGAVSRTQGRFEQAQGGTIFLDEIGDMTPLAQAKILRVIENKQISRLGGAARIPLDFRLIAATNREPEVLMDEGSFREDLYYRLNVARVHIPSLRRHREDIEQLLLYGIQRLNKKFNRKVIGLKKDVVSLLTCYDWRGNVRELMNVLEGAYINMPAGQIDYADLPTHFKKKLSATQHLPSNERQRILNVLVETNWNKTNAAAKLNWSRMTLYRKMAKHRIVDRRSQR